MVYMFSIYSSAFNLVKNQFDYVSSVDNFCKFADEVVIAVNTSLDETLIKLLDLVGIYPNLKIVQTDFSYEDPLLDGKIKNVALQHTSCEYKIGLDMDERIPLRHKHKWEFFAKSFEYRMDIDCIMVPSINLYGSLRHIKSSFKENLGAKWYLHKKGLHRGPVNFALNSNGTVDTSKSDTCELIYSDGSLVKSDSLVRYADTTNLDNYLRWIEKKGIYVFHLGYVDFEKRVLRNLNFWCNHWIVESGGVNPVHKVHTNVKELDSNVIEHKLPLWQE
jgi:hypothetical protein